MDLGDIVLVGGDGARGRLPGGSKGLYVTVCAPPVSASNQQQRGESQRHAPLDKVLEGVLDDKADLVLDSGDVGEVCWPGAHGNLIIGKPIAFAVAERTDALGWGCCRPATRRPGESSCCARGPLARRTVRCHEPSIAGSCGCRHGKRRPGVGGLCVGCVGCVRCGLCLAGSGAACVCGPEPRLSIKRDKTRDHGQTREGTRKCGSSLIASITRYASPVKHNMLLQGIYVRIRGVPFFLSLPVHTTTPMSCWLL